MAISSNQQRIITGIGLISYFAILIFVSFNFHTVIPMQITIAIFIGIGSGEVYSMIQHPFIEQQKTPLKTKISKLLSFFYGISSFILLFFIKDPLFYIIIFLLSSHLFLFLGGALAKQESIPLAKFSLSHFAISCWLIIPLILLEGIFYKSLDNLSYLHLLIFGMLSVYVSDSGAYFIGRKIGKRKLSPLISPNKSIEGAIGGVFSAAFFGSLYAHFFQVQGVSHFFIAIVASILLAIFGQTGDLLESALKRFSFCKDSGSLFPGHGGVMDRLDSLLAVAPFLWFLSQIEEIL